MALSKPMKATTMENNFKFIKIVLISFYVALLGYLFVAYEPKEILTKEGFLAIPIFIIFSAINTFFSKSLVDAISPVLIGLIFLPLIAIVELISTYGTNFIKISSLVILFIVAMIVNIKTLKESSLKYLKKIAIKIKGSGNKK